MQNRLRNSGPADRPSGDALRKRLSRERREDGFAIIMVLWAIGLLAVVAASIALATREHVVSTGSRASLAIAEAAAEGALNLALFEVAAAAQQGAPKGLGEPFVCRLSDDAVVSFTLEPETGKIDLNAAPAPLLNAFFVGLGAGADRAEEIAQAIEDFRDIDKSARSGGGEDDAYRAAGLAYGPKNAAFDAPEELAQVIGIDRDLYVAARPHVTVLSRRGTVDPSAVAPALRQILTAGGYSADLQPASSNVIGRLGGAFTVNIVVSLPRAGFLLRREARVLSDTLGGRSRIISWLRNPPVAAAPAALPDLAVLPSC